MHPRSTTQTLASGRVKRFSWESCPFVGYWRDEWECRTDQTYVRVLAVSNSRTERQDIGGRLAALDDMFALTSTATAPWHAVPAEYKWFAPIAVAKTVVTALGKGIVVGPSLDPAVVQAAAEILSRKEMAALGLAGPACAKD